jgi:hypothetical protein
VLPNFALDLKKSFSSHRIAIVTVGIQKQKAVNGVSKDTEKKNRSVLLTVIGREFGYTDTNHSDEKLPFEN